MQLGRKKQRSDTVETALTAPETQKSRRNCLYSTQSSVIESKDIAEMDSEAIVK
jgi:hypothetical protein